jgi:hypothetical protein
VAYAGIKKNTAENKRTTVNKIVLFAEPKLECCAFMIVLLFFKILRLENIALPEVSLFNPDIIDNQTKPKTVFHVELHGAMK